MADLTPMGAVGHAAAIHTAGATTSVSLGSLLIQMVVGLVVVVALVAVAGRLVRAGRGRGLGMGRAPLLKVIGRQSLAKGAFAAVVRVGGDAYLLGVTQHQVTKLARLGDADFGSLDGVEADAAPRALLAGGPSGRDTLLAFVPTAFHQGVERLRERTVRRG